MLGKPLKNEGAARNYGTMSIQEAVVSRENCGKTRKLHGRPRGVGKRKGIKNAKQQAPPGRGF